jgi:hypothetical protein
MFEPQIPVQPRRVVLLDHEPALTNLHYLSVTGSRGHALAQPIGSTIDQ